MKATLPSSFPMSVLSGWCRRVATTGPPGTVWSIDQTLGNRSPPLTGETLARRRPVVVGEGQRDLPVRGDPVEHRDAFPGRRAGAFAVLPDRVGERQPVRQRRQPDVEPGEPFDGAHPTLDVVAEP